MSEGQWGLDSTPIFFMISHLISDIAFLLRIKHPFSFAASYAAYSRDWWMFSSSKIEGLRLNWAMALLDFALTIN